MKKKMYIIRLISFMMLGTLLCACGSSDSGAYKSSKGWSVKYNPKDFKVTKGDDFIKLEYKKESPKDNMEELRYIEGKLPEEVLGELTDTWNADPEKITRHEGIFPGTDDKWGYWREYEENGFFRTAIAGEYNGGSLLFYSTEIPGDGEESPVSDALSEVINSITYDSFEPQTMYDYIPGKYVNIYTDNIEGEDISVEYFVQLNDDHTGLISLQDDIEIMWGSYELMRTTPDFEKYEYTIEGDTLYLNLDEDWRSFERR